MRICRSSYVRTCISAACSPLRDLPRALLVSANGSPDIAFSRAFFSNARAPTERSRLLRYKLYQWHEPVLAAVGPELWGHSYHYYTHAPGLWTPDHLMRAAKLGREARHA